MVQFERTGIVVHSRQARPWPIVVHEMLGETTDGLRLTLGTPWLPSHVEEGILAVVLLETPSRFSTRKSAVGAT